MGANPVLLQDPARRERMQGKPFCRGQLPSELTETWSPRCAWLRPVPPAVVVGTLVKAQKRDKIRDSFGLVPPGAALGSALRPTAPSQRLLHGTARSPQKWPLIWGLATGRGSQAPHGAPWGNTKHPITANTINPSSEKPAGNTPRFSVWESNVLLFSLGLHLGTELILPLTPVSGLCLAFTQPRSQEWDSPCAGGDSWECPAAPRGGSWDAVPWWDVVLWFQLPLPVSLLSCPACSGVSPPNWFSSSVGRVLLFRKAPKYVLFAEFAG